MSVSLAVLLPVILLGIVGVFCFTGCALDSSGIPGQRPPNGAPPNGGNGGPPNDAPFTKYSDTTVLANSAVVAYWPLSESGDNFAAADRTPNPINGQYIDPNTLAAIYPWPAVSLPNPPNPDIESAAAPGGVAFAQIGIVPGDTMQPANDPASRTPCLMVNGCYVNVPFNAKFNTASFTLEAWVRVEWDTNEPHAWRAVLDARDLNPCTGFAIIAKADDNQPGIYHWMAVIGNGGSGIAGFTFLTSDDPPIKLKDPSAVTYYLAVTYDGFSQTLILYVDGEQRGINSSATYMQNTTDPLWIGAGIPYVPLRPQAPGVLAGPLFPFVGAIQDVAIYNAALTPDVILTHYHNGNGADP
jgi:Concanavalin A-like lectin/glucanases superfamily